MKVLLLGAGYSALRFGQLAAGQGAGVSGTTRSVEKAAALPAWGVSPIVLPAATGELVTALRETTHLLVSIPPVEDGGDTPFSLDPELLRAAGQLRWIGYLSTVGVYGDHQGAWVDEDTGCRPVSSRSVARLAHEQEWAATARTLDVPLAVLRLSGIYGPGRNAFVNLRNGTARRLIKKDQVFNRIHVDDIAGSAWHLAQADTGGIFNITDDQPAPAQDVVTCAAELMGVEPPPELDFETAQLSPMARSFYGENKRVSNARIRQAGYAFRYPDYRSALEAMWKDGSWAGRPGD